MVKNLCIINILIISLNLDLSCKYFEDTDVKLNKEHLNKYLYFGFVKNNSLIDNLNQVPPGHFLEFEYDKNKSKIFSFWKMPQNSLVSKADRFEILDLLKDSLIKQLRSDVPTGFLLSGGIDSSLLVSLSSKISSKKIFTYNVSYNEKESIIENKNANLVARLNNTNHTKLKIDKYDIKVFLKFRKVWRANYGLFNYSNLFNLQ